MDAMDQTKCNCPHIQNKPKWAQTETCQQSQIGSFVVHGHGTYGVFWDENNVCKDANLWATALVEVLRDLKETEYKDKPFPEVLYVQCDNGPDNKNWTIPAVCELLRDLKIFRKVKLCFLPVGHTHEDVDASFGALSRRLRDYQDPRGMCSDALTFADFEKIWRTGWKGLRTILYVKVGIVCAVSI